MPLSLSDYVAKLRERLKASQYRDWTPPTLPEQPPSPGRRRLRWDLQAPLEQPSSVTLDEMRDDLLDVVGEYADAENEQPLLVRVAAGGGKTYAGILMAQKLAADYRVLWAAGRHRMFDELWLANEVFDPRLWYHWRPMDHVEDEIPFCRYALAQRLWMSKGYRSFHLCRQLCMDHMSDCPYRNQAKNKKPVVFAMHQHLATGLGIRKAFDIAIVDELPLSAFLWKWRIPADYVVTDREVGPIRDMVDKLRLVGSRYEDKSFCGGKPLLDQLGPILDDVFAEVEIDENAIPTPPEVWQASDVFDQPYFWLPQFLTVIEQEWQAWRHGWSLWPVRVTMSSKELRLLWRKEPWTKLPTKLIALDATSQPRMYERIFANGNGVVE